MTLKEWRAEADYFSQELSALVRNLCFSGIAVVWLLKGNKSISIISYYLLVALLCFIAGLLLDMAFLWYSYYIADKTFNKKEKRLNRHKRRYKNIDIESVDTGGWNVKNVSLKKKIRLYKNIICIAGYFALFIYVAHVIIYCKIAEM